MSTILIGGGGHAAVLADTLLASKAFIRGFFDDHQTDLSPRVVYLGSIDRLADYAYRDSLEAWMLAIGDVGTRRRILDSMSHETRRRGAHLGIVHPSAVISEASRSGIGCFFGARSVVQPRARVGEFSIINTGAIVEHDCCIGENVHVAPGAVLGGNVTVGDDTLIGLGARVKPGVRIGKGVTVGVGAVVVDDVPDGQTVVGVPARAIKSKAST